MVELLRPTLRGEPLDFSAINKRNTLVSKGRDPINLNKFAGERSRGFDFAAKSNNAASKVRATNAARGKQLDRLNGGDIVAGSISKAPTKASQQAILDSSLEEKGNR